MSKSDKQVKQPKVPKIKYFLAKRPKSDFVGPMQELVGPTKPRIKKESQIERHIIKHTHPKFSVLDEVTFLSKNLYNATLYAVRQQFFADESFLEYAKVNKQFTHDRQADYIALPAKVAKHTQQLVDQAYRSFFGLLKTKQQHPKINAKLPKYLDKTKGRQVVHYEKGALSFKKPGFIKLSGLDFYIKTKLIKKQVAFVRLVPKGNHITVEIGYEHEIPKPKDKAGRIAGLDVGLNNLATLTSNVATPMIVNGRPLKSINQFYNKHKAVEDSKLDTGQKTSKARKQQLGLVRKNKIADYLHKSSRHVVNYLVANNIDTLVIGKNIGWKQDINIGKRNNQNFVAIPFTNFIKQVMYKAHNVGVEVIYQEESYTSKCSFFDNEAIQKHDNYAGCRVHRGLFKTASGKKVNADVNGSLNIIKKHLITQEAWNDQLRLDLVEASSTPNIPKFTPDC